MKYIEYLTLVKNIFTMNSCCKKTHYAREVPDRNRFFIYLFITGQHKLIVTLSFICDFIIGHEKLFQGVILIR